MRAVAALATEFNDLLSRVGQAPGVNRSAYRRGYSGGPKSAPFILEKICEVSNNLETRRLTAWP
ncbi:hypothetical protein KKC1_03910 [Calderihabitans maritimus]|uniref:Uncharacterized protein n=1 Tax=Calderihabitans maritimus TaxID=1246530 RepID=A0A1Z5HNW2_9FIRM|nr:hypothetical protein KKC1_03910 [Calderihabitans maritimus]